MSQEPIPYKAVQTGSPALAPEGAIPIALYAPGGSGGGAVDSVNGKTGDVVLSASDIGAVRIESGALVGVPLYASPDDLPAEGVLGGLYFVNAGQ